MRAISSSRQRTDLEASGARVGGEVAREARQRSGIGAFGTEGIVDHAVCADAEVRGCVRALERSTRTRQTQGTRVTDARTSRRLHCWRTRPMRTRFPTPHASLGAIAATASRKTRPSRRSPQSSITAAAGARNTPNGTSGSRSDCWPAPSGELRLRGGAAAAQHGDRIDDREEGHRADRRADEHGGDGAPRAERGADERHQRHVAHPHRLAAERRLAEPADDGDEPCPGARADERVEGPGEQLRLAEERRDERAREHHDQPGDREAVRDEVVLEIGDRDAEQQREEEPPVAAR